MLVQIRINGGLGGGGHCRPYPVDQHDQVVGAELPSGIISHHVILTDQGPVDGAEGKRQQFGSVL